MEWLHRYSGKVLPKGPLPFKSRGTLSKQLKIALLFTDGQTVETRKDILLKVGVDKKLAYKNGYNSSLFSTLTINGVIEYDKKNKTYKAGWKYKEYLKHCSEYMMAKGYHKKENKIYLAMLKETSQSLHFILE